MNELIQARVTETNGFFKGGEIITVVFDRVGEYGKLIYKSVGESALQADGGWVIGEESLEFIEVTRTFYRVKTPSHFSDLNDSTLEGAIAKMDEFGAKGLKSDEYTEYWAEQRAQCRIVEVTEVEKVVSTKDLINDDLDEREAYEGEQLAKKADGGLY